MPHRSRVSVAVTGHAIATDHDVGPQPTYRVNLTLAVTDPDALWRSALEKGLESPGMDLAALVDVLGPREDPSIADCIALLTAPRPLPGCSIPDYWIDHVPAPAWLPLVAAHAALERRDGGGASSA